MGTILAAHLIATERRLVEDSSTPLDNKPVVQASRRSKPGLGRYLTDIFYSGVLAAKRAHRGMRLTLRWVPGHEGVDGNEIADEEAKEAAAGRSSDRGSLPQALRRRTLPLSVPAKARQNHPTHLKQKAATRWRTSKRRLRLAEIDESLPSPKYMKLTVSSYTSCVPALRLSIDSSNESARSNLVTARRPTGGEEPETALHFLLSCPSYSLHRAMLLAPLGWDRTLARLLNSTKGLALLFAFINATGHFRHIH